MQKWEHLRVAYEGDMTCPNEIHVWPTGIINLLWLNEKLDVTIDLNFYESGRDVILKLNKKMGRIVSKELLFYLQNTGWEIITHSLCLESDWWEYLFLKRPLTE